MTVQTVANLSNSIRTQYIAEYVKKAYGMRLYDQLATPVAGLSMEEAMRGSTVRVPFLSGMAIGTSTIPTTADVTPTILYDSYAEVTPTSRYGAIQWNQAVDFTAYTDYASQRFQKLAENQMETVEALAIAVACAGDWVERAAARTSLDAGTLAHRANDSIFSRLSAQLETMKVPGFYDNMRQNNWAAIMHPHVFHDILESGNVDSIGLYQDAGIHLNYELGKLGPFRLISSAYAKVFGGVGANNATDVSDTLAAATTPLATTFTTSSDDSASIAAGLYWSIGTAETSTTFYPNNERVRPLTASTTTISGFIGEAENGGLRFPHASGETVTNSDSAYTIVLGGPGSMVKLFVPSVGEFGEVVGPETTGILKTFTSLGWKFYGGYGVWADNTLLRYECSVSAEA